MAENSRDPNAETLLPATQRSDGTWRRAVRVRKGYNPDANLDAAVLPNAPQNKRQRGCSADDNSERDADLGLAAEAATAATKQESTATPIKLNLDPYACCANVSEINGMKVYSASVASNLANEGRILLDPARGLFGIFDGHGGSGVASYASETIGLVFEKYYKPAQADGLEPAHPGAALKHAFKLLVVYVRG